MKLKIILLLFLLIAIVFVAVFYFISRKFYARELSLRLSPLTENNTLVASGTKFWMLGDSRIYQWNIPGSVIASNQYCNLGVNSQTTAQVLYRLDMHFEQATPEYVFVQVGINDLKAIGIFPGKKEAIISQCIKNIELIIKRCTDHKVKPVFCSIFPPGEVELVRRPIWSSEIKKAVIVVNDSVTNFCKHNGIAIFDTHSALNDGNGILIKKYQADDLHLNEDGYKKLNEELAKFLTKENIQ